jgi:hypothetical protein
MLFNPFKIRASRTVFQSATAFAATALLAGCVYLPETTTVYNSECGIYERRVTLEGHQVASIMGCRNEGCAAALVVAGVVSATTAVVSGSVVVIGKVVYWLEKQGQCLASSQRTKTETTPANAPRKIAPAP